MAVSIIPRSWDHLARALQRKFHVVAPDLRGHGESEWATGSSYSLADHVYDLTRLVKAAGFEKVSVVGHSMGGMVSLTYAGVFPGKVSRLVVLDGVTNYPARLVKPADVRIAEWTSDLDDLAQTENTPVMRRSPMAPSESFIATGILRATRRCIWRPRPEPKSDGTYGWKFDPYLRARAPYRLSLEDHIGLWSRIACPTLLVSGSEKFLPDPARAGVMKI